VKHWGKALFGLAVTAILLWWVLRNESPAEIMANIARGNFWLLGASVVIATSGFMIRAWRWKVLLAPVRADTALRSTPSRATVPKQGSRSAMARSNRVLPAPEGPLSATHSPASTRRLNGTIPGRVRPWTSSNSHPASVVRVRVLSRANPDPETGHGCPD